MKKIKFHRTALKRLKRSSITKNTSVGGGGNTIPWDLLDELDGEKKKFELEKFSTGLNLKML